MAKRRYANPRVVNLLVDPKEREPAEYPHMHTWVFFHFARLMAQFEDSVKREPLIPFGAPIDFIPTPPR